MLIIDADDVVRDGLTSWFSKDRRFRCLRPAGAPTSRGDSGAGIIVVDPEVKGVFQSSWLRETRQRAPEVRIIVFTRGFDEDSLRSALDARVDGYLLKGNTDGPALREAVGLVAFCGLVVVDPAIQSFFADDPTRLRLTAPAPPVRLTEREGEVLRLHAGGLGDKEVAARLGIGASTVETHMQRVQAKLEARSRSQAVYLAVYYGILDPLAGELSHD